MRFYGWNTPNPRNEAVTEAIRHIAGDGDTADRCARILEARRHVWFGVPYDPPEVAVPADDVCYCDETIRRSPDGWVHLDTGVAACFPDEPETPDVAEPVDG